MTVRQSGERLRAGQRGRSKLGGIECHGTDTLLAHHPLGANELGCCERESFWGPGLDIPLDLQGPWRWSVERL